MNEPIIRHAYVRSACNLAINTKKNNLSSGINSSLNNNLTKSNFTNTCSVNSPALNPNSNSQSIFNMDSIIVKDQRQVLRRKKQLQGLDILFFENLLQAEDQLTKKRYTSELINQVVGLYAKCVEYYDSVQDPIKHYFLEKIQITLSSKESLKLIYTPNVSSNNSSNISEANTSNNVAEKENLNHSKNQNIYGSKKKNTKRMQDSSHNNNNQNNSNRSSILSSQGLCQTNLLSEKNQQFTDQNIMFINKVENTKKEQINIKCTNENDTKLSLVVEQLNIKANELEDRSQQERINGELRFEKEQFTPKKDKLLMKEKEELGTPEIINYQCNNQQNHYGIAQHQSHYVDTESNRMSTVEETEKESARYSTLRSFCEWTDQDNISFSNSQKHITVTPFRNPHNIGSAALNNSSSNSPKNSFRNTLTSNKKLNSQVDYLQLLDFDDHITQPSGDKDRQSSQLYCQVFTSFIEGVSGSSQQNHNDISNISDLLYERQPSRAEMNVQEILGKEGIHGKGVASRLIEHGKNLFNLTLARDNNNLIDNKNSYLNYQITQSKPESEIKRISPKSNSQQSNTQHLRNSKSLNNLSIRQPEVYSIPQKRIERSKRFSLFINMHNQKQQTDIKSDFSKILSTFEKDSMKKDAIVKGDIDQQMNLMRDRINQRKSKNLLSQATKDMKISKEIGK